MNARPTPIPGIPSWPGSIPERRLTRTRPASASFVTWLLLWLPFAATLHASNWAADWTPVPFEGIDGRGGVAISKDGTVMAATGFQRIENGAEESWRADVALSRDAGRTWQWTSLGKHLSASAWIDSLAMNGDGTVLAAGGGRTRGGFGGGTVGTVWVSSDRGGTWRLALDKAPEGSSTSVVAIAREANLIFLTDGLHLHRSDDLGTNWTRIQLPALERGSVRDLESGYQFLGTSADGQVVAAAAGYPPVCNLSQDGGATWRTVTWPSNTPAPVMLRGLALSADGKHLAITARHDFWESAHLGLFISDDAGAHWRHTYAPGRGIDDLSPVALSDDGRQILIGFDPSSGTGLGGPGADPTAYSTDGGETWKDFQESKVSLVAMSANGRIQIGTSSGGDVPSRAWLNGVELQPAILETTREGDLEMTTDRKVTFSVTAIGGKLTYQWRRDGEDLTEGPGRSGTRTSTLVLAPATPGDLGRYSVRVSNAAGSAEADAGVFQPALAQPAVMGSTQSGSEAFIEGAALEFRVSATGGLLDYQWRRNGADLTDGDGRSGSRSPTFRIASARIGDLGEYSVVVRNSLGSIEKTIGRVAFTAPRILGFRQSGGPAVRKGDPVRLEIWAEGGGVTVQWHRDGVPVGPVIPIPGAITNPLVLPSVQTADLGRYTAVLSNHLGTIVSPTFPVYLAAWEPVAALAPGNAPRSLSISPDGNRLLILSSSVLRHSMDAGATWSGVNLPGTGWTTATLHDQPGHWLLAGQTGPARFARTSNFGAAWEILPAGSVISSAPPTVATSGDGQVILASTWEYTMPGSWPSWPTPSGRIHLSRDGGATWQEVPDEGWRNAGGIALSHDGRVLACTHGGWWEAIVHISHDGGITWTQEKLPLGATTLSMTASGDRIYCNVLGSLYVRTGRNGPWEPLPATDLMPVPPCVSDDGRYLHAVQAIPGSDLGQIVQSSDGGRTWRWSGSPAANWTRLAGTADGSVAYAISSIGLFRTPTQRPGTASVPSTQASSFPGGIRLEWKGEPHRTYALLRANSLVDAPWRPDGALVADADGRILLETPTDAAQGFWRLTE